MTSSRRVDGLIGGVVLAAALTSSVAACAPDRAGPGESSSVSIFAPTDPADRGNDADTTSTTTTSTAGTATTAPAPTTTGATPPTTVASPRLADVEVVVDELGRFDRPVDLVTRPGDDALYVVQQRGTVVRWTIDGGGRATVLDVRDEIADGGEQGLLGLAFASDGRHAFVNTTNRDGETVITEYPVTDDGTFGSAAGRTMMIVPQPYTNHNAGDLAVDGRGLLYIALGDGGSAGDPERRAHDPTTPLGSLLRVDPVLDGSGSYRIPDDNPFADGELALPDGTTIAGAAEVFAWGLRNPWKFAIDPVTGDLWIPDVGQNDVEEINMVPSVDGGTAGRAHDFGWSAFEGTERFNVDVPDTGRTTAPVLTYRHGPDGCSISGGEPYRGSEIPALVGAFVYGDYCSGRLSALRLDDASNVVLVDGLSEVTAVRADATGELYVLEAGGRVLRLRAA